MRLFYRMDNFLSPSKGFRHPSQILRVTSLKGEFSIFNSAVRTIFIRIFATATKLPSCAAVIALLVPTISACLAVPFFGNAKFQNIKVYCSAQLSRPEFDKEHFVVIVVVNLSISLPTSDRGGGTNPISHIPCHPWRQIIGLLYLLSSIKAKGCTEERAFRHGLLIIILVQIPFCPHRDYMITLADNSHSSILSIYLYITPTCNMIMIYTKSFPFAIYILTPLSYK